MMFAGKTYKDMTRAEKIRLDNYLTNEMWNKGKTSITCPICGGVITTEDHGSASITACSTQGCVYIVVRGI